ncbi:MAG: NUDIX hydrolase [Caulobacteraceae bacterium]|nr:NUDIX hydrolase [Caulobacteraceae bacterium]
MGVVCLRGDEVLLIQRGKAPRLGQWSIPGGRMEFGETTRAAALRELKEETGVEAEILGLIDVVDSLEPDADWHGVLVDYVARWTGGEPVAGDDAMAACFQPVDEALRRVDWEETRRVITLAVRIAKAGGWG